MTATTAKSEPQPSPWKEDVAYGKHPLQKLDVFKPEGSGPFPFVLDIHAGGWQSGDITLEEKAA